jgi:DNA-binding SARP family transcriptional activator
VVSRGVEVAPDADSPWHELGRALIAQGVSVNVPVALPVRLREFGTRAILVDGAEVKPRIAKSYELLAYVLSQAEGECDRDRLLDVLFDGRRDESTRAYLRQAIRWLRETLPDGAFLAEGQTVCVGTDLAVSSESVELENVLAEAARLQGPERLEATLAGLAIYDQGAYLPGNRGAWADEREHRLGDQVTEARYQAAVLAFGEGRYDESRSLIDAVLHHDRYREAAWRLQMRVAQALGDQEGAIRAFKGCETALAELGGEPSSSTRMLLDRARR